MLATRLSCAIPAGHCTGAGFHRTLEIVTDHGERSAEADRIDTNGAFRRALRAALVAAVERPPAPDPGSCERDPVRAPMCVSHTARQGRGNPQD